MAKMIRQSIAEAQIRRLKAEHRAAIAAKNEKLRKVHFEYDEKRRTQEEKHRAEIESERAKTDKILNAISSHRHGMNFDTAAMPTYRLTLDLDPKIFGMLSDNRRTLELIGKRMGEMVEVQIARSHFVRYPG